MKEKRYSLSGIWKKKEKLSNKSVLIFLATALEFFPLRRPHVKTRCHWTRCHWTSPVKIRKKIFHPENNTYRTYILFLHKKCFFVSIQYRYQYCTFSTKFRWTRLHKTIWASTIGDKHSISFPIFFFYNGTNNNVIMLIK